jgi:large subunit ribosomal protein L15
MTKLHELKNTLSKRVKVQRVGRGPSSGRGKTSSRGVKGAGARSGYRRRYGYEGGQMRLYTKLPIRGFSRGRFQQENFVINLEKIEETYIDGEVVNFDSLIKKRLVNKIYPGGLKILGVGSLTKKVKIEANDFSKSALKKLEENNIEFKKLK